MLSLYLQMKTPRQYRNTKYKVSYVLTEHKVIMIVTAPHPNEIIRLKCPIDNCTAVFNKNSHLLIHLKKSHGYSEDLELEQQYYCTEENCIYNQKSRPKKFFAGRKFLNQHMVKKHKNKAHVCDECHFKFPTMSAFYRHQKTCNLLYLCVLCRATFNNNETYLVHLARKHPSVHAIYKQEKRAQKRSSSVNNNTDVSPPKTFKLVPKTYLETGIIPGDQSEETFLRPDVSIALTHSEINEETSEQAEKETENTEVNNEAGEEETAAEVERSPPWFDNNDVFETTVTSTEVRSDEEINNADKEINNETINDEAAVLVGTGDNECYDAIIGDDEHIIEEEVIDEESKASLDVIDLTETIEDTKEILGSEFGICPFGQKKTSATQFPEITNDVSLNPWDNKNDFEIQTDDMSTQTVFGDLLRSQQDDIFFSESVSLSDIQTQTMPLEFGLTQNHKGTQSQSPDLSYKETQTSFDLYDNRKRNFRIFDSRSSSPGAGFISNAQTQTSDLRSPIRSDVLLSFSSAETQTYYDDFRYTGI